MSGPDATVVRVRGARRAFAGTLALDGVDLEARRGEWVALLGPNGAGKTTLMRALTGRVRLDAGLVEIAGKRVDGRPRAATLRKLGVVPQSLAVYAVLTVRENLRTFAALHGVARAHRTARVDWALEWTGLADRATMPAGHLSGGMQRRLNVACGVLHRPDVVLLDEPTAGVDAASRARIRDMLASLRGDGAALIHSSHEIREIEQRADRVVVLHLGRVVADGPPEKVIAARMARERRIRVVLERAIEPHAVGERFEVRGSEVLGRTSEVARDLTDLLARLERAGAAIRDVHVERPGLEDLLVALGRPGREP